MSAPLLLGGPVVALDPEPRPTGPSSHRFVPGTHLTSTPGPDPPPRSVRSRRRSRQVTAWSVQPQSHPSRHTQSPIHVHPLCQDLPTSLMSHNSVSPGRKAGGPRSHSPVLWPWAVHPMPSSVRWGQSWCPQRAAVRVGGVHACGAREERSGKTLWLLWCSLCCKDAPWQRRPWGAEGARLPCSAPPHCGDTEEKQRTVLQVIALPCLPQKRL